MESLDDAGVYKMNNELAIIQTVDFFTPIVDDPYSFGQIAVANALSDVYAMGGKPLTAMNIVCFPIETMAMSVLTDILRGGLDKMQEADVILMGGHTVDDTELKYGLSVTGTVHPDKLISSEGACTGDKLILTKPLGTGIINTALKANMVSDEIVKTVTASMASLNKKAAELMQEAGAHACTDITGFGLLGHSIQLAESSNIGIRYYLDSIPFFPEVVELARQGLCPGGLFRNKDYYLGKIVFSADVTDYTLEVLFDAQTSGGLLISVSNDRAGHLLERLQQSGINDAAIIGEIIRDPVGKIILE